MSDWYDALISIIIMNMITETTKIPSTLRIDCFSHPRQSLLPFSITAIGVRSRHHASHFIRVISLVLCQSLALPVHKFCPTRHQRSQPSLNEHHRLKEILQLPPLKPLLYLHETKMHRINPCRRTIRTRLAFQ